MKVSELEYALELIQESIEKKLKKAGIYYRFFSRVKTEESLASKMKRKGKNYGLGEGQKRIEDILGIRIILYYFEDIDICKEILENTFRLKESWSENNSSDAVFQAQKINGVFYIPQEHIENIKEQDWNAPYPLAKTFEVQMRTVLFEGWHEIEHDIRYKDMANNPNGFWHRNSKLSRVMNSVIANLELCEWTMTEIFEKIADTCVEEHEFELALRSRFRLNIVQEPIHPQVKEYLTENKELAERLFSIEKRDAVFSLLRFVDETPLTPNHFLFVLNRFILHDEYIRKLLKKKKEDVRTYHPQQKVLEPLYPDCVYCQEIGIQAGSIQDAAHLIYQWAYEKLERLYAIPEKLSLDKEYNIHKSSIGYKFDFVWNPAKQSLQMDLQHISSSEPGMIWHVKAKIQKEGELGWLKVKNICEACESRIRHYNRPIFMKDIFYEIGYKDAGMDVSKEVAEILPDELERLIANEDRQLPIVVAVGKEHIDNAHDFFDGYTINVSGLQKAIAGISHVFRMENGKELCLCVQEAEDCNLEGAVLYWKKGEKQPIIYREQQIREAEFEEVGRVIEDDKEYDYAFRKNLRILIQKEMV